MELCSKWDLGCLLGRLAAPPPTWKRLPGIFLADVVSSCQNHTSLCCLLSDLWLIKPQPILPCSWCLFYQFLHGISLGPSSHTVLFSYCPLCFPELCIYQCHRVSSVHQISSDWAFSTGCTNTFRFLFGIKWWGVEFCLFACSL